jgi:hypothetical protein
VVQPRAHPRSITTQEHGLSLGAHALARRLSSCSASMAAAAKRRISCLRASEHLIGPGLISQDCISDILEAPGHGTATINVRQHSMAVRYPASSTLTISGRCRLESRTIRRRCRIDLSGIDLSVHGPVRLPVAAPRGPQKPRFLGRLLVCGWTLYNQTSKKCTMLLRFCVSTGVSNTAC